MIEIVTEFIVNEEARGHFELVFGPGGAWSKLCEKCPGFRGTSVLRDVENPRRYLTIEVWDAPDKREQMLAERGDAYAALQATLANWAERTVEVGTFRMMAEATVRPRAKGRRGKPGATPRGARRPER